MQTTRLLGLAAVLSFIFVATACGDLSIDIDVDGDGVRGSGNVITETRAVSGFDEIEVLGSGRINVSVTGTESVTIEAEDNIMPLLTTSVSGSRLELGLRESFSTTEGIVYTITVVDLVAVEINGSGNVFAEGIDTDSFDVEINGSGNIAPIGAVNDLNVAVNGSGNYNGERLVAVEGSVLVSGSGSAIVNVTDVLDADVGGSGSIEYLGDPVVSESVSGSGSVSRR